MGFPITIRVFIIYTKKQTEFGFVEEPHLHTHTHTHARSHARTHARTHSHTPNNNNKTAPLSCSRYFVRVM